MTETWRTGSRCCSRFIDIPAFHLDFINVVRPRNSHHRFQARNRSGQVGYVPEKYLQLPSSNSLLSMLQALAALDARSHSSSNSTEPETELATGSVNGDSSGEGLPLQINSNMSCCSSQPALLLLQCHLRRRCTTTRDKRMTSCRFRKVPSSAF